MAGIIKAERERKQRVVVSEEQESDGEMEMSPRGPKRAKHAVEPVVASEGEEEGEDEQEQEQEQEGEQEDEEMDKLEGAIESHLVRDEADGYVIGSIVRIHCENFLTYTDVEFFPGPDLNLVIGPNGSGKSAISCSIVVGLGFPLSVLGRAKKLTAFTKQGEKSGSVEIELKGAKGKPNPVFKRMINSSTEDSIFKFNNKAITAAAMKLKLEEYHIQVNNLCNYLPQDRVAHFSTLSGPEVLKETQKAAGSPKLSEWHGQLIAERKKESTHQVSLENESSSLKAKVARNAGDLQAVKQIEERLTIQAELDILALVIPSVEFMQAESERKDFKSAVNELTNELAELEHLNKPFVDSKAALEGLKGQYEKANEGLVAKLKVNKKDVATVEKSIDLAEKSVESTRSELEKVDKMGKTARADVVEQTKLVAKYQAIVDKKPDEPDWGPLKAARTELNAERIRLAEAVGEKTDQQEKIERRCTRLVNQVKLAKERLEKLNNRQSRREAQCKAAAIKAWTIMTWTRKHAADFKGQVCDPVRMVIDAKDSSTPLMQNLAEAAIAIQAFDTTVCELQEDYDYLTKNTLDRGSHGNIVQLPQGRKLEHYIAIRKSRISDEEVKALGFDCFAIDLITGPDLVLAWLCENQSLHMRPVCLRGDVDADLVATNSVITRYYSAAGSVSQKRSLYGNKEQFIDTRPLKGARALLTGLDQGALKEAQREYTQGKAEHAELMRSHQVIADEIRPLKSQIENIDRALRDNLDEQKVLGRAMNNWKAAGALLESKQLALERALEKRDNLKDASQLKEKMGNQTSKRILLAGKYAEILFRKTELSLQSTTLQLQLLQVNSDYRAMANSSAENDQIIAEKTREKDLATTKYQASRATVLELRKKVVELREDASKELQAGHDERMGREETMAEVQEAQALLEARLEQIAPMDGAVRGRYEKRKLEIAALEEKIEGIQADLDAATSNIAVVKKKWFPALERLVAVINKKFGDAFTSMGCQGEIKISEDEDYDKWGIEIWVSFRDYEAMRILDGYRQSGGERALVTVMYLMSLAEMATGPFGLVDEINQGMDQRVERQVHNQLVATTCKPDVGQYFLLTPKLLPDLNYHPKMKVLIINNGDWVPDNLSLKDVLAKKVKANALA